MTLSIIMATYNSESTVKESINSILKQSFQDYELIIMDGDSTDNTCNIIKTFKTEKIIFRSEADAGVYEAFNKGLGYAKGDWIFFIGSDDILYNNDILSQIKTSLDLRYQLIYTNVMIGRRVFIPHYSNRLLLKNTIHHQGALYNKSVFKTFKYNEKCKISADYELNLQLFLNKRKVKYLNTCLSICGEDGLSGLSDISGYEEEISIRNEYIKSDFLKSILAFLTYSRRIIKKYSKIG